MMIVLLSKYKEYRVSYVTTWRIVAGSVVMLIFLWIIPWRDIENNKIETLNRASKELQEPTRQDAIMLQLLNSIKLNNMYMTVNYLYSS
jgi:hypothetical protein